VEAHVADARVYMLTHPKEFDVVRHLSTHSCKSDILLPFFFQPYAIQGENMMNTVVLAFDWNDDFSGSGCGGFAFIWLYLWLRLTISEALKFEVCGIYYARVNLAVKRLKSHM
jgi:hypothetical protein